MVGAGFALACAAAGTLPALAHDDDPAPRIKSDGSPVPERADRNAPWTLQEAYDRVNPDRFPGTYVCSNPGDEQIVVVHEHRVEPGRTLDPAFPAGPEASDPTLDPCHGKSQVIGR